MIECHPLLRPVVQLAKPVVHAVRHWHPHVVGIRHHVRHAVHRVVTAATPPTEVVTVCQRVAGPIVAGGLVLLPPASAVPPLGGVGGFPGAAYPEYGAPAFGGPGFPAPFAGGYAPGGYGPAALGLAPAILAPGPANIVGPSALIAFNSSPAVTAPTPSPAAGVSAPAPTPISVATPGTSIPAPPVVVSMTDSSMSCDKTPTSGTSTGSDTSNGTTQCSTGSTATGTNVPGGTTPSTITPGGTTPGGTTPGGTTPGGTTPGNGTPVDTPEPASLAMLASGLAVAAAFRARRNRRDHRGSPGTDE